MQCEHPPGHQAVGKTESTSVGQAPATMRPLSADGEGVGGPRRGDVVGDLVGDSMGDLVGDLVGEGVPPLSARRRVGAVGLLVGERVGEGLVSPAVGLLVGDRVGEGRLPPAVGLFVGDGLEILGCRVGARVDVGLSVGLSALGGAVGPSMHCQASAQQSPRSVQVASHAHVGCSPLAGPICSSQRPRTTAAAAAESER